MAVTTLPLSAETRTAIARALTGQSLSAWPANLPQPQVDFGFSDADNSVYASLTFGDHHAFFGHYDGDDVNTIDDQDFYDFEAFDVQTLDAIETYGQQVRGRADMAVCAYQNTQDATRVWAFIRDLITVTDPSSHPAVTAPDTPSTAPAPAPQATAVDPATLVHPGLAAAVTEAREAAEGDSNDTEIAALHDALDLALGSLDRALAALGVADPARLTGSGQE